MSPRLREKFNGHTSWEAIAPIRTRFEEKAWEQSPLNWMSFIDLNLRLAELLLMRVDKMTMGVSLEGRVPFLDHKLVELSLGIPANQRYRRGETKRILKRTVRNIIPDNIIDRKKQGFGVPVHEWFLGRLGMEMRSTLDSFCQETDFFDKEEINYLFDTGNGVRIWFLFNFVLWWNRFIR